MKDGLIKRKTLNIQKIKEENWGMGCNSSRGKTSLYLYKQNMNTQNYLIVLEEAIEEMKELRDISKEVLFLQIDNARYHWSIEALEFYYENNIKIINWPSYPPYLNPIENIWDIIKRKIAGKNLQLK